MKTRNFEKKNSLSKSSIEVLSQKEMKEISGGVVMRVYRDVNGKISVVIVP